MLPQTLDFSAVKNIVSNLNKLNLKYELTLTNYTTRIKTPFHDYKFLKNAKSNLSLTLLRFIPTQKSLMLKPINDL